MSIRDQRQEEFAEVFLNSKKRQGILYLCPRFGKCRVGIKVFEGLDNPKILIAYPDIKIKQAWLDECEKMGYSPLNITFTTHRSLHKYSDEQFDLYVIDEIHLLSEAQIDVLQKMLDPKDMVLGLTGTMTSWTERDMRMLLKLNVLAQYPISTAIEEGVITDYEIIVKKVPLDGRIIKDYNGKRRTEKQQFKIYSAIIKKFDEKGKNSQFLRLARMRVIQNSESKLGATRRLLKEYKDERVLVFCGLSKIADRIGCPVYHSKKGEEETFNKFCNGEGNHMAVVKIGNTGVTYKPLNRIIINYFDSNGENLAQKINRCMAMEYDNLEKKAIIHIITSDEEVELAWLEKALEFFDKEKVKYI